MSIKNYGVVLVLSAVLLAQTFEASAGQVKTERCKAMGNFFVEDQCTPVRSGTGPSATCEVQLDPGGTVTFRTQDSVFVGRVTSSPVYGYSDVMNVDFGGLVRGGVYRHNGQMTSAAVYLNDDSSGQTYTRLTCRIRKVSAKH